MKKPVVFFTVADERNMPDAKMMANSLKKFHPDIPLIIYGDDTLKTISDPAKFYKQKPMFGRELIDDYELVIGLDCDQIITGNLNYIIDNKDYDVGTVLNYNKQDAQTYGLVTAFDIPPEKYFNCGLVAIRSPKFIENWFNICNSYHFNNLRYREQDILNILCSYGDYRVKCFDDYDHVFNYSAWHGLASKGQWNRIIMRGDEFVLPRSPDNYPERDKVIKVLHWAGGGNEKKMNYRAYFNEAAIKRLDYLTK